MDSASQPFWMLSSELFVRVKLARDLGFLVVVTPRRRLGLAGVQGRFRLFFGPTWTKGQTTPL